MLSRFNTATSSSIFSGGLTPQGSFATDDWSLTFVSDDGQAILESSASLEGQARGGMDSGASLTAQMESMAGVSFACGILERAMPHIHNDEVRAATATAAYVREAVLTHEEGRSTSFVPK